MAKDTGSSARADYASVIKGLTESIPGLMDKGRIPGLSISLVDGDDLIWGEGFGFTDRAKTHEVTADTPFSLQSISKTYTATGFLIAVKKGLVGLDEPLRRYYPEFCIKSRFGEREADKITFRHLLSHWSGLTHEAPIGNNCDEGDCTFEDHIGSISDSWLKFPVGDRFSYSNLGIDLVGYALERISGRAFAGYMKEALFDPLGMTNSTYDQGHIKRSTSYAKGHVGMDETPQGPIPMIPSGALFSTARDMAKFVSFHLAAGVVDGNDMIDEAMLEEMYTPQFRVEHQVAGYGLGVSIGQSFGTKALNHSGGGYGYLTIQEWIPEYGLGAVVLTNQAEHNNVHISIADDALRMMVAAKFGAVPEDKPVRYIEKPEIRPEPHELNRLAGRYRWRGGLLSIEAKGGGLYAEGQKLCPHSETEFTSLSDNFIKREALLTFVMGDDGNPKGVRLLDSNGLNYLSLQDSPNDGPGPNKEWWVDLTGIYSFRSYGDTFYIFCTVKNGHLYGGQYPGNETKLVEFEGRIFFTCDGEAVIFKEGHASYANILLTKETDPYRDLERLARSEPGSPKLRDRSLQSLIAVYYATGLQQRALDTAILDVKLHPEALHSLLDIAEAHSKVDKRTTKELLGRILEIDPQNQRALEILKGLEGE